MQYGKEKRKGKKLKKIDDRSKRKRDSRKENERKMEMKAGRKEKE